MVIQNDPSARMQLRSRGELQHPGQCMVCGSGTNDDGYLDLGVFFDYEGTCYLCMTCAYQAGETVGLFTPAEVAGQLSLIETLKAENDELKKELNSVRPLVGSLKQFLLASGMSASLADSVVAEVSTKDDSGESEVPTDLSGIESGDSSDVTGGSEVGESGSEEPVKGKRRSNAKQSELRDQSGTVAFT